VSVCLTLCVCVRVTGGERGVPRGSVRGHESVRDSCPPCDDQAQ
jgi:hypothetical protein